MKKYFRIVLKGPHPVIFFDMEVNENLSLPMWWANVTLAGAVVHEKFCITYDQVAHVSVITVEQAETGFKPRIIN